MAKVEKKRKRKMWWWKLWDKPIFNPRLTTSSAIRTINTVGIEVLEIVDTTPLPHNGCRPPKARRI